MSIKRLQLSGIKQELQVRLAGAALEEQGPMTLTLCEAHLILPLQPNSPPPSFNNSNPLKSVPSLKSLEGPLLLMRQSHTTISMTLKIPLYWPHPIFLTSSPDFAQHVPFLLLTSGYWSSLNLRAWSIIPLDICSCCTFPPFVIFFLFHNGYSNGQAVLSHCSFD